MSVQVIKETSDSPRDQLQAASEHLFEGEVDKDRVLAPGCNGGRVLDQRDTAFGSAECRYVRYYC